jgi:hypothetical protein
MPLPTYIVIPNDMGSNIKEGSTVPGALPSDVNHWVAAIRRGTGFNDYIYPDAAVGADAGNAVINNSDAHITTPLYVKQFVAAALAALPAGTDTKVQSVSYNSGTRVLKIIQTDGSFWDIAIPVASSVTAGLIKILTASQIAGAPTDDANAATPRLVYDMIAAAIAALPPQLDTKVSGFNYNPAIRQLSISDNNAGVFNVILPIADNNQFGLVKLAVDTMYPTYGSSNVLGATPAFVLAAITDAISNLPADKFLQGLQSYDASTNTMVLALNDGSTVNVDMTNMLNDAIASIPDATAAVRGLVRLAVAATGPSTSAIIAATPEWVNMAIAAAAHAPASLSNTDGFIGLTQTGTQSWVIGFNLAAMPSAAAATRGLVQLATAAEGPVIGDESQAATPAYVESRINALVPQATGTVTGKVQLATAAEGQQPTNETDATTPAYVAQAIAGIPAVPVGTGTVQGKLALATAAEGAQPGNESDAATPAYVEGRISANAHPPMTFTSGNGSVANFGGGQALDLRVNIPAAPGAATDTTQGIVSLGVAANYPSGSDTEAATPAYVAAAIAAIPPSGGGGGGRIITASVLAVFGSIIFNVTLIGSNYHAITFNGGKSHLSVWWDGTGNTLVQAYNPGVTPAFPSTSQGIILELT